jgi:integrase/recombinase XerD
MNTLRQAVREYLSMRRALGFKLQNASKGLLDFATFLEQQRASYITLPLALAWAKQRADGHHDAWTAQRLSWVRLFARYQSATDSRTQIPPTGLLPYRPKRTQPYLYSDKEIQQLLRATLSMPLSPHCPDRARCAFLRRVYYCLFGLLSVSGLRLSEARNLELQDVDLQTGVLRIRGGKFGKYAGRQTIPIAAAVNGVDRENSCIRGKSHSHVSRHSYAYRPSRNVRSLPCGRYRPALLA